MFVTPRTYYAPDEPVAPAGDPAPEAPPAAVEPIADAPPVVEGAPPEPVDWSGRVTEWGGEDEVVSAIALRDALRTPEGVKALFYQAGRALGHGDDRIDELFAQQHPEVAPPESTLSYDDLVADPDRILTAGEVAQLLKQQEDGRRAESAQQRVAQMVTGVIDTTFTDLKVADEADRHIILTLADSMLGGNVPSDPAAVESAIRRAHAQFDAKVQANAEAIVTERAALHDGLPNPLPAAGGGSGGAPLAEPKTVDEAKRRTREQLQIA